MNREIKFRGKDRENWHYGDLVQEIRHNDNKLFDGTMTHIRNFEYKNGDYIGDSFPVNSETIGQYTGLHDKNGKEIYEGDIVEFEDTGEEGYEYKEGFDFNNIAQVVYKDGIYTLANFGESDNSYYATDGTDEEILGEVLRNGNCKVIGNIYDNPELLGGE